MASQVQADRRATVTQVTFLQPRWTENQLRMHVSNNEVDGLQKQKTTAGSSPVSTENEFDVIMDTIC